MGVFWNGEVLQIPHSKETSTDDYIKGITPVVQYMDAILSMLIRPDNDTRSADDTQPQQQM
jgi:hypothetical protein